MDVKPWEPVIYLENRPGAWPGWYRLTNNRCIEVSASKTWFMKVTLANGQRIIVRALSEDRKAARKAKKEANQ